MRLLVRKAIDLFLKKAGSPRSLMFARDDGSIYVIARRRCQRSNPSFFKNIKKFIATSLILISSIAYAGTAYLSNGFFMTNRVHEFNKITKSGKCKGIVEYPEAYREDSEIIERLNDAIKDFVETYNLCDLKDPETTKYEVKEGSLDYFSIKWITTNSKQIPVMINSLSFDKSDGHLLTIEDILNPLAKNFLPELVKLSENHLAADTTWEQFLDKIEQRYIQFYIQGSKWNIVFNPHRGINVTVVEKELPNYLLKS